MIQYSLLIQIPGFGQVAQPNELSKNGFTDLASFLSVLYDIAVYAAAFLAFYYLIWGAYQYIMARGEKEKLSSARSKIMWAIIGLAIVLLAYTIAKFASEVFPVDPGKIQPPI